MKNIIKLEEAAMLMVAVVGVIYFNAPWWCYVLMAIGPDISMLGYLGGNKPGAFMYNLFHHKAVAIIIFIIGFYVEDIEGMIAGLILFGHSSFDRLAGYGLKLNEGFSFTHLGRIGKHG